MSSVAATKSSDWWKWDAADLQRKARATRSSDPQDYADRGAAANILAGRKNWTSEQLRIKAEASRYDYDDYDDKLVAQAIRKRDREDALKEPLNFERLSLSDRATGRGAHESSRRSSERMPAPTSSNAGRQNGGNIATTTGPSPSTGRTPSQRNTPAPSTNAGRPPPQLTTPGPSTSAGKATSSREGQSAKAQTQTKREHSSTRESQPSKRLANILPAQSVTTASGSSRGPQGSSARPSSTTEVQHSSRGRRQKETDQYEYVKNKDGKYICTRSGCTNSGPWTKKYDYERHFDNRHDDKGSAGYKCKIGDCLTRTDGKNIMSRPDALQRHYRVVHPESSEGQKAQETYEKRKLS